MTTDAGKNELGAQARGRPIPADRTAGRRGGGRAVAAGRGGTVTRGTGMSFRIDVATGPDGASVHVAASSPPRLLGDGCGCRRWRECDRWHLEPCERHAREILDNPEAIW